MWAIGKSVWIELCKGVLKVLCVGGHSVPVDCGSSNNNKQLLIMTVTMSRGGNVRDNAKRVYEFSLEGETSSHAVGGGYVNSVSVRVAVVSWIMEDVVITMGCAE